MLTEEAKKQLDEAVGDYKQGNRDAFNTIVELSSDTVFRICINIVGDYHSAEDVMQEVYISVFKSLPEFRQESLFSTWLYRIALNKSLSAVKKGSRKETVPGEHEFPEIAVENGGSDNIHKEELMILRECIGELSPSYKNVILLRDIEGLSYEEIGEIENIPVGTVRSRLNRGREMVKDIFVKRLDPQ